MVSLRIFIGLLPGLTDKTTGDLPNGGSSKNGQSDNALFFIFFSFFYFPFISFPVSRTSSQVLRLIFSFFFFPFLERIWGAFCIHDIHRASRDLFFKRKMWKLTRACAKRDLFFFFFFLTTNFLFSFSFFKVLAFQISLMNIVYILDGYATRRDARSEEPDFNLIKREKVKSTELLSQRDARCYACAGLFYLYEIDWGLGGEIPSVTINP